MQKWIEIEQFRHVVKYVKSSDSPTLPTLLFRGTVKLHGCNIGITRDSGHFYSQSRNQILGDNTDLYGFRAWFDSQMANDCFVGDLNAMFDFISKDPADIVTIYGEWVGPGIQSSVAINKLPECNWFIFGAKINQLNVENSLALNVPSCTRIHNILEYTTFWQGIDFNESFDNVLIQLQNVTLSVENQCPVGEAFGLQGIGEGIVWTCLEYPENTNLVFKTKGEKHSGKDVTTKKVATVSPEILKKIDDVVNYVLTDGRLQQGLDNIPSLDMQYIGTYLKWISADIIKEELDTIEANELTWKDIAKPVTSKARQFLITKVNNNL